MKKILILFVGLLFFGKAEAKVRPASLFNDGMVLQQQSNVKVWGWAAPNKTVTVVGSWNKKKVSCKSDDKGRWELRLATPAASFTPYEVTISDGEKLTIKDVLIGEVWLGSGQSNMEMPLVGYNNCPIENLNQVIAQSNRYAGKMHFVNIGHQTPAHPADSVKADWKDCLPENIWTCSATCYFFATTLVDALNCPVGIINSSWGGTKVECWMPKEDLESYEELDLSDANISKQNWDTPVGRYNGMIHPIVGYNLRGFIWYQGEANRDEPEKYMERLPKMINTWRNLWQQGTAMPFYFVEIAPFRYEGNNENKNAFFRETQCKISHLVPNSGMVCTNDLVYDYEDVNIHPCKKKEVGERLCWLALKKTYGKKGLMAESPEYQSMEIKDDKIFLTFSESGKGFNRFRAIEGFEIAGADRKFYPADVRLDNIRVVVSSKEVKEPVAVRYGFRNFLPGNLKNVGGMPVIPFRTDNWDK